jgi:MFS transporter, PAT family, beta-lactamase induction signal transducer AmpG
MNNKRKARNGWWWVPTLYYAEGIPYIVVMTVSVIMYKRMGISNTDIALYTSWLYLPWVMKPFWSPLVDMLRTKRFWIVTMQLLIGAGLGGVALTIPLPDFFQYTLLFFWLLAFSSATHDIAADGFYMLGLSQYHQAWFVGVRSTFYRFAMITGQGLLVILAGSIESSSGLETGDIVVYASPGGSTIGFIDPDSIPREKSAGELKLYVYPESIRIPLKNIPKKTKDSLLAVVRDWNIRQGYVAEEKEQEEKTGGQPSGSWWTREISSRLEKFIRRHFGVEQRKNPGQNSGNVALIYFYLSKEPDQDEAIILNFGRNSGDKSIYLDPDPAAGTRLVFDQSNWNRPAMALIELDPKLKDATQAVFSGQAGNIPLAWSITFLFLTALFFLFFIYHKFVLPYPASDGPARVQSSENYWQEFIETFVLFFKKDRIYTILGFLLFFRLAESQIVKLASPFLLDAQEAGGLALTTGEVGLVYGTAGILALTAGGLLGGFLAARNGLKFWIWPMAIAINLPDIVYVYLSYALPDNLLIINICVAIEQFGYGFGFTAYMLYMIYVSEGDHKTAHFAITTGFMALGMMIPGMISGYIQELIGYGHFFIWVMIATIPSFLIIKLVHIDPAFGRKKE